MSEKNQVEIFFATSRYSILFILIPPLILFFLILIYGVNAIIGDEWAVVSLIDKFFNGNFSFIDIFEFHNEHRIPFPKMIMILNSLFFKYNSKYQMFLSWFFLVLSFFIISIAIKNLMKDKFSISHIIILSFLIFNMRQWENLLYGWQFQIPMLVFFSLVALYAITKSKGIDVWFWLSVLFSFISTYTFANGLVIWFVGFLNILLINKDNKKLYLWLIISIFIIFYYFYGHIPFINQRAIEYSSHNLLNIFLYFMVSVGSPLTTEKYTALIIGFILIFLYIYVTKYYKKHPFFVSILIFSLISSFVIALSRSGYGWQTAIASRYVSFYMLGPICIYSLFLYKTHFEKNKINIKLSYILLFLFCFQIITSFSNYFKYELVYSKNKIEEYKIKNYKSLTNNQILPDISEINYLKNINPELYEKIKKDFEKTPEIRREYSKIIEKYQLNVFKK